MTDTKKTIIRINASLLKQSACDYKVDRILQGYTSRAKSNDIEFGSAFHLCASSVGAIGIGPAVHAAIDYFKKVPKIINPKKSYMDEVYLTTTCMRWFTGVYMSDSFATLKTREGKELVEVTFSWPLWSTEHFDFLAQGTIDKIVLHKTSKVLAIGDYKTTSTWDKEKYLSGYKMSTQLDFYAYFFSKLLAACGEDSILHEHKNKQIHRFIDGVFLMGKDKDPEFKRSDVVGYNSIKMAEFESMLMDYVKTLGKKLETGLMKRTGRINGACQTVYGPCEFFNVCSAIDERAGANVLANNFIVKPYEPLKFGKAEKEIE